ncbi:MAG: hypothetical protein K2X94_02175 [Amoebophilaceae bacterium]|nr:hypothetical protein [Amoebophilaceae bacterium]
MKKKDGLWLGFKVAVTFLTIFFSLTTVWGEALEKDVDAGFEPNKEALPLEKLAHKNALALLSPYLVQKPLRPSIYVPFIQHIGIRLHWLRWLQPFFLKGHKYYQLGVDFHFSNDVQLFVNGGYASYSPKNVANDDTLKYPSKGRYLVGSLEYVWSLNHLTNAYFGIGYGYSSFELIVTDVKTTIPQQLMAHFIKINFASELKLITNSNLYGGLSFELARLMHDEKNDLGSHYIIPGYGAVENKINFSLIPYVKWRVSFLEKKINP